MEDRLNILCHGGLIDEETKNGVMAAADLISKELSIDIKSEQFYMVMIHLANAATRIKKNLPIEHALESEILEEIKGADNFHFIESLNKSVCELIDLFEVPETENSFLLSNLYSLSLSE